LLWQYEPRMAEARSIQAVGTARRRSTRSGAAVDPGAPVERTLQSARVRGRVATSRLGENVPAETHVEKPPMDRQQVFELIRDQLAEILEIEPSAVKESSSFVEDLDADSLALIELVEALEEEIGERTVGFRIDDEDLEDLRTVRDAVDYVVAKLGAA
jgi:acyl carrier protein